MADAAQPTEGRALRQGHVQMELIVCLLELAELGSKEHIVAALVGEDQTKLGLVDLVVLADALDELEHGGDAGATSNHANVLELVGFVLELDDGALHLDVLAGAHGVNVVAHLGLGVALHEELAGAEIGGVVVDGSVGTDDILAFLVVMVLDEDAGADGEVGGGLGVGEGEEEATSVVGLVFGGDKAEVLPFIRVELTLFRNAGGSAFS